MSHSRASVPVDDYVIDVLMRDLVGHDRQPAAFLVYLWLFGRAARTGWHPVPASLRMLASETGLSKSAVQAAVASLQRLQLVVSRREHRTAAPSYQVLRHWRDSR